MNYIPIGGWCGTKVALKDSGLFDEPSLPFDSVRVSMEGVIDCIENDFQHFFPKEIERDFNRFKDGVGFIGEYVGFYHGNHDLVDENVIESFKRKFVRFDEKIKKNNCIFLRTTIREDYNDEIKHYKKLQEVIDKKYPDISYIICFIIHDQPNTQYYRNLDNRTFLFTVNDKTQFMDNLKNEYKPIFDFIANNNLFDSIPIENHIEIDISSRLWFLDGYPAVNG